MNSFENAVMNAVFPTERPPTIGIQIGRLSLSESLCPQFGHSASRFLRPLKNAVGSFSRSFQNAVNTGSQISMLCAALRADICRNETFFFTLVTSRKNLLSHEI